MSLDSSQLRFEVVRARAVGGSLAPPVTAIAAAATVAAALVAAAVGSLYVERRRGQVQLLAARGVAPGGQGVLGAGECLLPLLLGGALGWAVAVAGVPLLGPSRLLDAGARAAAVAPAALGVAGGLVVLGLTIGVLVWRRVERPLAAQRSWAGFLPWELALVVPGALLVVRARGQAPPVTSGTSLPSLTVAELLGPLLLLIGVVALVVRATVALLGLGDRHRAGSSAPAAVYIAARRVTAARAVTAVFLPAVALPSGCSHFLRL